MKFISIYGIFLIFFLVPYMITTQSVSNECTPLFGQTAFHSSTPDKTNITKYDSEYLLSAKEYFFNLSINTFFLVFLLIFASFFTYQALLKKGVDN